MSDDTDAETKAEADRRIMVTVHRLRKSFDELGHAFAKTAAALSSFSAALETMRRQSVPNQRWQ